MFDFPLTLESFVMGQGSVQPNFKQPANPSRGVVTFHFLRWVASRCVVRNGPGAKRQLLVVNAGDSRVLLGRRDGSIVDGGGTDKGEG